MHDQILQNRARASPHSIDQADIHGKSDASKVDAAVEAVSGVTDEHQPSRGVET